MSDNVGKLIQEQVLDAYQKQIPLEIKGNGTKAFYGQPIKATPLNVSGHNGIISYEPTELVITAKAGTSLAEIESVLSSNNQQLAFEPPHFSTQHNNATLGGTIACGLSGPARANKGSVRDFVLGCEVINGRGEQLNFGGQVMKNVAGYDVSRLMCGSLGTLGVILSASLKVLPTPELETSLSFELTVDQASKKMSQWCRKPYPITASCYHNGVLTLRLAGNEQAVKATLKNFGGETLSNSKQYWSQLKEHQLNFFNTDKNIWRLSTKEDFHFSLPDTNKTDQLTEWHGALHWIKSNESASIIRQQASLNGGHATLFYNKDINNKKVDIFHPLEKPLLKLHKNLKDAFDPKHILNRNKMYRLNEPANN